SRHPRRAPWRSAGAEPPRAHRERGAAAGGARRRAAVADHAARADLSPVEPVGARVSWDVIIAGGGVGGLAAALALSRHGLRVLVLERRSGPGNVNRGDSLLPAVTAHLRRWGGLE